MVKVMYLPLNFSDVVQQGVYDAFRDSGCDLKVFDYFYLKSQKKGNSQVRSELIAEVGKFRPDLIHMQIQHTDVIDAATVREIKKRWGHIKISNLTVDVRNYIPKQYKEIAKYADFNFITSTSQLDMFRRQIGPNVYYWQIGYDPILYHPAVKPPDKFEFDVVFIANYTRKENYPGIRDREKLCTLMRQHFGERFGLFGGGWPSGFGSRGSLHQRKLINTYHKSFCSVSVNHFNDLDHYFSDRLLMSIACGRPVISYRFPKWETFFTDNCDLLITESIEQIPHKVKFLLKNREAAEYIGKSGAEKVYAEHTYLSRIKELLDIVGLK